MTEPVPVSGEDQPDPRQRALRIFLDAIYAGADYSPETILGALDEVDRAAGIRRVKWPERQRAEVGAWWTAAKRDVEGTAHEIASFEGEAPEPPTDNLPSYDLRLWVGRCGAKAPLLFSSAATVESARCTTCAGGGS